MWRARAVSGVDVAGVEENTDPVVTSRGHRMRLFQLGMIALTTLSLAACADLLQEPLGDVDTDEGTDVDDEADLAEAVLADDVLVDDDGTPALLGPPYPIVLVHGFSGWMDVAGVEYFYGVPEDLRAAGADVTAPNLPPYDSSGERALVLARVVDNVLARTHKKKVHLIAHSQGGIDSRTLITDLGYASRVASVHTISTPHRGTAVADVAAIGDGTVLNPAGELIGWLLGELEGSPNPSADWYDEDYLENGYAPDMEAAIDNLRPSTMARFNDSHPDPAGVPIFSIARVSNLLSIDQPECDGGLWDFDDRVDIVDPFFAATGLYLSNSDGGWVFDPTPNDGLVTVASSRWGTFLGCFAADHIDEIGQVVDVTAGLVSGFDHRRLYLQLLQNARVVETIELANGG